MLQVPGVLVGTKRREVTRERFAVEGAQRVKELAVFIARQDAMPVLAETFAKLQNAISTEEMRRLNYEVDGNKRTPKDVAAEWISAGGI